MSSAPSDALARYRRAAHEGPGRASSSTTSTSTWSYPVVSSTSATAVATRWRAHTNAPRAIVATRPQASRGREALRAETIAVPGCYARITAWTSREAWLKGLRLYLQHYPEALAGPSVRDATSIDTFMAVMTATAHDAERATGRGIRAHRPKVAAAAGCDVKTVQRVWRLARRRLGVLVDVAHARPLTEAERYAVRTGHRMPDGSRCRQRGVTELRAAHTPRWLVPWVGMATASLRSASGRTAAHRPCSEHPSASVPVGFVPPPRRAAGQRQSPVEMNSPGAQDPVSLRSTQRTRSARRLDNEGHPVTGVRPQGRKARSRLDGEALARELASAAPWAAGLSPRRSAPDFAPFEQAGWTAAVWLDVARSILSAPGRRPPRRIKAPFAFARWLCSLMVPDAPPLAGSGAADAPVILTACGGPRCDGAGWLLPQQAAVVDDGRSLTAAGALLFTISFIDDTTYAAPCPDCPPGVRSQLVDETGTQLVDDEPLF